MNERIRELVEQADEYAEQTVHYYQGQFDGLTWEGKIKQTRDKKFAELIVRECMACSTWVGKVNNYAIEPVHTAHTINQRMKEHFGVEE